MHGIPVKSKAVTSIGYDSAGQRLEIRFRDGRVYEYRDVPADVHRQFLTAASKGLYFNQIIRRRFSYVRSREATLS